MGKVININKVMRLNETALTVVLKQWKMSACNCQCSVMESGLIITAN